MCLFGDFIKHPANEESQQIRHRLYRERETKRDGLGRPGVWKRTEGEKIKNISDIYSRLVKKTIILRLR